MFTHTVSILIISVFVIAALVFIRKASQAAKAHRVEAEKAHRKWALSTDVEKIARESGTTVDEVEEELGYPGLWKKLYTLEAETPEELVRAVIDLRNEIAKVIEGRDERCFYVGNSGIWVNGLSGTRCNLFFYWSNSLKKACLALPRGDKTARLLNELGIGRMSEFQLKYRYDDCRLAFPWIKKLREECQDAILSMMDLAEVFDAGGDSYDLHVREILKAKVRERIGACHTLDDCSRLLNEIPTCRHDSGGVCACWATSQVYRCMESDFLALVAKAKNEAELPFLDMRHYPGLEKYCGTGFDAIDNMSTALESRKKKLRAARIQKTA